MPDLLILLFVICAVLLGFGGAWDAFFRTDSERGNVSYGMAKLILAVITLGWGWYLLV